MSIKKTLNFLFDHQLEQPRSILCFYAAWPIAALLIPMAVVDWLAGEFETVLVEIVGALIFFSVPFFFKSEHRYDLVRNAFSIVVFSGFLVTLFLRLDSPPGQMWLPLFPIFAYILLGDRTGHPMVIVMWLLFLLFAPFSELGLHNSVMLGCGLMISTVIANKYEWALHLYHARLSQLAEKDPVTGTANRRAILAYLDSLDYSPEPLALLMIDIDHFKQINDNYGHPAGDRALRQVGKQIEGLLRDDQRIGRWGGDEFVVVLPKVDAELSQHIGERLRIAVGETGGPSLSIGAAGRKQGEKLSALIHRADQALYRAKSEGRGRLILAVG